MKKLVLFLTFLSTFSYAQTTRYIRSDGAAGAGGTSWASAGNDLQATLSASSAKDTICIAAGTYPAPADTCYIVKNGIRIFGGFPPTGAPSFADRNTDLYPTVLQGSGKQIMYTPFESLADTTVLDGMRLTGGKNVEEGGALYVSYDAKYFIRNCLFDNNSSRGGGVIFFEGQLLVLNHCTFRDNTAGRNGGGAVLSRGRSIVVDDCLFKNNVAQLYGGAMYIYNGIRPMIRNSRFIANSTNGAGGAFVISSLGDDAKFINCLFTGNVSNAGPVGSIDRAAIWLYNCTLSGNIARINSARREVIQLESLAHMRLINTIVYGNSGGMPYEGGGRSFTYSYSLIQNEPYGTGDGMIYTYTDPLFVNPIPDSEAGDYRLRPCSPLINKGDNASVQAGVLTDLDGNSRIQAGTVDIGAFESAYPTPDPITPATASLPAGYSRTAQFQQTDAATSYLACSSLIASIGSAGFSGLTNVSVWVDPTQPGQYVARHYEITPANNPGTATGIVTLYFTQGEFDAFNAVSAEKLPIGPGDKAGIMNLRIEKRGGTSADSSGSPSSYPGSPVTINPADTDITWNAAASRWEVRFAVTGFSGFFVKAGDAPLPLRLLRFTGIRENGTSRLDWQTADEERVSHFAIERSTDGMEYVTLSTVPARNGRLQSYTYRDNEPFLGTRYYRLRMVDEDGTFVPSRVISLVAEGGLAAGPNPVRNRLRILFADASLSGSEAQVLDIAGRIRQRIVLRQSGDENSVEALSAGLYLIRFQDGHTLRFIKE
jgi:hypothetical protein